MASLAVPVSEAVPISRAARWPAELELTFGRGGQRTTIERRRHYGPLLVQRPFHPEADGTCHAYVLHPPGGVAGGDELSLSVEVLGGASALLTTPAAAKLYRTSGATASVRQVFSLRDGASLEWLPQETIAFGGSRVKSNTIVHLEAGAHFVGWEIACLGRPASGDDYSTGSFRQCTEIWRDGRLVLVDRTHVEADGAARSAAWGWASRTVYATLIASATSDTLVAALRDAVVPERSAELFAVTAPSGLTVCRFLGESAERARRTLATAWGLIRRELLGKSACPPRIWRT